MNWSVPLQDESNWLNWSADFMKPGEAELLLESHRSRLEKGQGLWAKQRLEAWSQRPQLGVWTMEAGTPKVEGEFDSGVLHAFDPWRKGPWCFGNQWVDSEWDSRLKWERIAPMLPDLQGKHVLDLGCGNGWYLWHLLCAGAKKVLGLDPMPQYWAQFEAFRWIAGENRVALALGGHEEALASQVKSDVLLCMGVLYHRKEPLVFLRELASLIHPDGTMLLETLVLPGDGQEVLEPERYASMRNCWSLPTVATLVHWLEESGWVVDLVGEVCATSTAEQRQTEWIRSLSLDAFLDPKDPSRTIEGHPAPHRVAIRVHLKS